MIFSYRYSILILNYNQHCFPDNTEMPDAMDVIFQTALEYGKSGAVSIAIWAYLFILSKPVQYGYLGLPFP